jgi:hypothetical protein
MRFVLKGEGAPHEAHLQMLEGTWTTGKREKRGRGVPR